MAGSRPPFSDNSGFRPPVTPLRAAWSGEPDARMDPSRIPVIVGVGEVNDRPAAGEPGMNPVELMCAGLRAADEDAGGGWLARCDRLLVVPQISFRDLDVPQGLADDLDLPLDRIFQAGLASGDTPVRHLHDAANAIGSGQAQVCMVAGGEALRTAAGDTSGPFKGSRQSASDLRRRYGLVTPSEIYPLFENATRAAWGQTFEEAEAETGEIWANMSKVAERSDGAWIRRPHSAQEIVEPTADNRMIAFPYTKLMVANASVNQGAAFIVTSLAAAVAAGVPEARLVYVGAGAAAHEDEDPLARSSWETPPGMRVSLLRALSLNGLSVDDLDHVELYSCFPCVPKMARRVIGWPAGRPVTVHGGLTFGGGPIGNYMSHAVAGMVWALRRGGRHGLLFANGGYCTHNHTIVLSRGQTGVAFPQDYDFQAEADAVRGPIPRLTDRFEGASRVETYTVVYDRAGAPIQGIVLSLTADRDRIISRVDPGDPAAMARLTSRREELVGRPGVTARVGDDLVWRPANDGAR